jgi:hypothetical protein
MKRIIVITLILILALASIVLSVRRFPHASADAIAVSTRDIPEHGLTLIGPASSSYESEMDAFLVGKGEEQREFIGELKPFSAFIRTVNTRNVVAYKLRWELSGRDMKTITHERVFADPALLMGEDPARVTPEKLLLMPLRFLSGLTPHLPIITTSTGRYMPTRCWRCEQHITMTDRRSPTRSSP